MQKAKKIEFTVSLAGFGSPNKEGKEGKYLYNQHVKAKNELAKNEGGASCRWLSTTTSRL